MPDKKPSSPSTIPLTVPEIHPDVTQRADAIEQAVVKLNIVRKNMRIYPPSHEQVQRSLGRAFERIDALVASVSPLTLEVMARGLKVGSSALDTKVVMVEEFARALKKRHIAAVSLHADIDQSELGRFTKLIATDPDEIKSSGGIEAAAMDNRLSKVKVQAIDYSKLHLTEEREIERSDQQQGASIWPAFVSRLLSDSLPDGDAASGALGDQATPSEVAQLLNARQNSQQSDTRQAIAIYRKMIAEHLREMTEKMDSTAPDVAGLNDIHLLIKELKPELQQQFLSVAYDQCNREEAAPVASQVIHQMGGDLVVRMLRQANAQGKQISPSLMALVRKMSRPSGTNDTTDTEALMPGSDQMQSLMEREAYETYVDSGYDRLLKNLSHVPVSEEPSAALVALRRELEQSLDEIQINCQVGLALTSLLAASHDLDEYRDWARQLTFLLDDLMSVDAFPCLADIYDFMTNEYEYQTDTEKLKVSGLVLNHFAEPHFVSRIVTLAIRSTGQINTEVFDFFERLGEPVAVEVLECLGTQGPLAPQGPLLQLLQRLGHLVVLEALERLKDSRTGHVRRALQIIRRFGHSDQLEGVKPLMDHPDMELRLEALATLLKFDNAWGLLRLRELMSEPWSLEVRRAIELTGSYQVREAVPALMAILEKGGPLGPDMKRREAVLQALGKIGDAQALPILNRLARRRWTMSKKQLLRLKQALFESLGGYPYAQIKDLLHWGLKQKDPIIGAACERRIKQQHAGARE